MLIGEAINEFISHLTTERNLSPYTIRNYSYALQRFVQLVLHDDESFTVADIQPFHIRSYIRSLHDLGLKPKTVNIHLCAIRSFTHFLTTYDFILKDPCLTVPSIKLPATKPNPMRGDEVNRFFDAINQSTVTGKRDFVIFQLALLTGLRAFELASLSVHDINLAEAVLYVRDGKGQKDRTLPLASSLCTLLNEYLTSVRPKLLKDHKSDFLFVSQRQHPLWESAIRDLAMLYAKKAGLSYRQVSPHIFRYTFATLLSRRSKADITVIKELLGHSNIQTTARYVGVVEEDKRRAVEGLECE